MKHILVITKTTGYESLGSLDKVGRDILEEEYKNHTMSSDKLKRLLNQYKKEFEIVFSPEDWPNTKPDIVISLGGDGTFLSAAQQYPDSLLLGINSDPERSIGALTSITGNEIEEKLSFALDMLMQDNLGVEMWPVLSVLINGEMLDNIAINEIYFGPEQAYQTCDFTVKLKDGDQETFNSSGLIISTGMGSHAWFRNAGGTPFSNELQAMGVIALNPNVKRDPSFTQKIVPITDDIVIIPHRDGYRLHFDSKPCDDLELKINDKIETRFLKSIKVIKP